MTRCWVLMIAMVPGLVGAAMSAHADDAQSSSQQSSQSATGVPAPNITTIGGVVSALEIDVVSPSITIGEGAQAVPLKLDLATAVTKHKRMRRLRDLKVGQQVSSMVKYMPLTGQFVVKSIEILKEPDPKRAAPAAVAPAAPATSAAAVRDASSARSALRSQEGETPKAAVKPATGSSAGQATTP